MLTQTLQVGGKLIQVDEAISLINRYQLLPQLVRNLILDQVTADINCTPAEYDIAIAEFERQQQVTSEELRTAWLQKHVITKEELADIAIRPLKIEKFKLANWGNKINAYFLTRKASLDQVIYSLIRTQDQSIANELYFRIQAGEQSFIDLAREYSQGTEANTGGLIGPVLLSHSHPAISKLLSISQPGQLWSPRLIADWFVIVRLEKFLPAQLDAAMHKCLLNELFEAWMQAEVAQAMHKDS